MNQFLLMAVNKQKMRNCLFLGPVVEGTEGVYFQVFYHSESGRLSVMASQFLCTSKSVDRYDGTRTSFKAVKATSDRHLQSILQTFHKRRHAV